MTDVFDITAIRSDSLAALLSLQASSHPLDLSITDDLVKEIAEKLDNHPHWSMIPTSYRLEAFRTLLKLISCRLMSNAHCIHSMNNLQYRSDNSRSGIVPLGVGLFPAASWFNHSCRANINSFFHGNKLIFVSMGIRKGQEVCDNYGVSFFQNTREERKNFLAGRGFTCDCAVCVSNESIDDILVQIIKPDLILKSLTNMDDYKKYRNKLPDGHRVIESIAEMCVEYVCGNDPEQRIFLYGEILESQRHRVRILLNIVLANYDAMLKCVREKQKYSEMMQMKLFAALVRMRTFFGKLHPAFDAAELIADQLLKKQEKGLEVGISAAIEKLRHIVESLKPPSLLVD
ncbi:hypothetical protein DICVIV_00657 [Dictyocaulus viviparus]|uniref:Uncharacterized protein n=1 Tax=Dictyocaulus viviparus TaxID=29172 RepID=A0A0D8YAV3_DICVI|nr:hypothetical protein DICVIV_00657 [Dictyocaulus viviparus]